MGAPAQPTVKVGDSVKRGQPIGGVPEGQLGVPIHASIDGVVAEVGEHIRIERRA
ncbi:MAG: hypothetical protein QGH45_06720 [Myxococcota bacterium]|nr:hypothetical protein [Myxococcota bacterium]